jgi:hypothetical protein
MLDWGRLPGAIKLIGLAVKPNAFVWPGELKSSISLLRMIPFSVTGVSTTLMIDTPLTDLGGPDEVDSSGEADGVAVLVNDSEV